MRRRLLDPIETMERLRCSKAQVYAISSQGTLPKFKIGNRLFFAEEDVEAYIDSCRVEAREGLVVV